MTKVRKADILDVLNQLFLDGVILAFPEHENWGILALLFEKQVGTVARAQDHFLSAASDLPTFSFP